MSRPPQPPSFSHPHNIQWRIYVMKFFVMQFSPLSVYLPLNILFSETLGLHSSLKVRDQVSHTYSTTGKITVLYIIIVRFFHMMEEIYLYRIWQT
jgi:hypothetical protein